MHILSRGRGKGEKGAIAQVVHGSHACVCVFRKSSMCFEALSGGKRGGGGS